MKYVPVLFLSLSICNGIYATSIDSLLAIYTLTQDLEYKNSLRLELAESYLRESKVDSAIILANEAIAYAHQEGRRQLLAPAYLALGKSLLRANQFNASDSILDCALRYAPEQGGDMQVQIYLEKFDNDLRRGVPKQGLDDLLAVRKYLGNDTLGLAMAEYCASYGIYLLFQTQLPEALNWLLKAKHLGDAEHFDLMQSINHNLATIYMEIGAYDKALQVVKENERLARKKRAPYRELFSLYTIATAYLRKAEFDSVKITCKRAMELKDSTNISTSFGYIYYQLGQTYLAEQLVDSAIYSFEVGIRLSKAQNERKEEGECHYGISVAYLQRNELDKAAFHAAKAQELLFYYIEDLNYHHAEIHARRRDYEKAYAVLNEGFIQQQAIDQVPASYQIMEALLTDKFEQERKQAQLLHRRALERQSFYAAFIFLALVFIALLLILYNQAKSKKALANLNTELNSRNQDLTHFAYISSHDLKEPIRNINSFAGLIKTSLNRKKRDDKALQEYLDFIISSAKTSYQIIDSLRLYSDLSKNEFKYETVEIGEVLQFVENDLADLIMEKNGLLTCTRPEVLESVYFSRSMLILILKKLIRNGFTYNDAEEPSVKVRLKEESDQVIFQVSDNGRGIETAFQKQIFQPFKTLENKSLTHSSGLGLAICKSILDKTGNKIWVESEYGQGSRFYFSVKKKE